MYVKFPTLRLQYNRLDQLPSKKWQEVTLWRPRLGRLDGDRLNGPVTVLLPGRWLTRLSSKQHGRIWKKAAKSKKAAPTDE
jgi:hypothetical protein